MEATTYVTQSKYFSTAFNSAIFDGPIRMYFAQAHEAQALKIYFYMQARLQLATKEKREKLKRGGTTVFVMLYPTQDLFDITFNGKSNSTASAPHVQSEKLGAHYIVGVRGPLEGEQVHDLYREMSELLEI